MVDEPDGVNAMLIWQLAPAARDLVEGPAAAQSLDCSAKLTFAALAESEVKVWVCWLRLVIVSVRIAAGLVKV